MPVGIIAGWYAEVSIRAPREGGDDTIQLMPVSGAVSIRAPREGGDKIRGFAGGFSPGFNPRPP